MKIRRKHSLLFAVASALLITIGIAIAIFQIVGDQTHKVFERAVDVLTPSNALVLGAKVWGLGASPMLEDRLQTALELYQSDKATKIIVSGGPSVEGPHESDLMYEWLLARGVPAQFLVRDLNGTTTLASLTNARDSFGIRDLIIVTQRFHLPRALYIAGDLGLNAKGVVADHRPYEDELRHRIREFFALQKAVLLAKTNLYQWLSIVRDWFAAGSNKEEAIAGGKARITERFRQAGVSYPPRNVKLHFIKADRILRVYAADNQNFWHIVHQYPVLAASGRMGPKLQEGDLQVPEGIYRVTFLNRRSRYHLSLRLNYPNAFDQAKATDDGRSNLGSDIMIHGNAVSIGCIAIGNTAIEEVFALASDTDYLRWTVVSAPFDLVREPEREPELANMPEWYPVLLGLIRSELEGR